MLKIIFIPLVVLLLGPFIMLVSGRITLDGDYRTADRSSVHIAPDPLTTPEAIVQVYGARAFNWRGLFSLHMWIAFKPKDAKTYTIYEVIGWRQYHNLPVLVEMTGSPDRKWFNQIPEILFELRGASAETAIAQIKAAAAAYPYKDEYRLWPGPNSNSFVAYIVRNSSALNFALPTVAVGKDYLGDGKFFGLAPSGTGYQFSLYGLLGIVVAKDEGLEVNILGMVFAINPLKLFIAIPGLGKIG